MLRTLNRTALRSSRRAPTPSLHHLQHAAHPLPRTMVSAPSKAPSSAARSPSGTAAATASAGARISQVHRHMSSSAAVSAAPASGSSSSSGNAADAPFASEEKTVKQLSEGGMRTILLNRPKALNALNTEMVDGVREAIENFTASPNCNVIVLRGEGRALCSGGDVMAVVQAAAAENPSERQAALDFFKKEFELDHRIARLGERSSAAAAVDSAARDVVEKRGGSEAKKSPKTFVSVMDGITMGGGVGLSLHAPFRIATERTLFAMPETGIGYFPDVGVTRCLARLDGCVGFYLGLTGARINGVEAYLAGLASHYIPSSSIPQALHRLSSLPNISASDPSAVSAALDEYAVDPFGTEAGREALSKSALLGARRIALDYAFNQRSAEAVFSTLEQLARGDQDCPAAQALRGLGLPKVTPEVQSWASETRDTLEAKSPRSIKVTLLAIAEARRLDVDEAFRFDMRLATAFCDLSIGRDFHTGVMHTLAKDPKTGKRATGRAAWDPPTLSEVSDASIRTLFFADPSTAAKAGLSMSVPTLEIPAPPSTKEARHARDVALRGQGPLGWEPAHNVFALPSEAEFAALEAGAHPGAGSVRLEQDELVDVLRRIKGDKPGTEFKVREYLQRTADARNARAQ